MVNSGRGGTGSIQCVGRLNWWGPNGGMYGLISVNVLDMEETSL